MLIDVCDAKPNDLITSENGSVVVGKVDRYDPLRGVLQATIIATESSRSWWSWHQTKGLRTDTPTLPVPQALRQILDVRVGAVLTVRRP